MTGDNRDGEDRPACKGRRSAHEKAVAGFAAAARGPRGTRGTRADSASGEWRDDLICNDNGHPRQLLANATAALRGADELADMIAYNEFSDRVTVRRAPPWPAAALPRDWTDYDDLHLAEWLQRHGVTVGVEIAAQAAQTVAVESSYHPVRDYLEALEWDGQERLDFWLTRYLGVENTDYSRAVGRRFLISAVARILQPGCKADCILVLEGGQGTFKSTALQAMADPWFTDQLAEFGTREAAEQLGGIWLIEVSELESMTRAAVDRIKAFASRRRDRNRPAYGRRTRDFPRQCVFAGSVNRDDYLRDETGARRFWPVRCGAAGSSWTICAQRAIRFGPRLWPRGAPALTWCEMPGGGAAEMIAINPETGEWRPATGLCAVLPHDDSVYDFEDGDTMRLYETPLGWLAGGAAPGSLCVLEWDGWAGQALIYLIDDARLTVVCDSTAHLARLRALARPRRQAMLLRVPRSRAAAPSAGMAPGGAAAGAAGGAPVSAVADSGGME